MLTLAQKHTASPRSEAHSRGPRFQEAIDRAAMRAGKGGSDAYLEEWRRVTISIEAEGALEDIAQRLGEEIESQVSDEELALLVKQKGFAEVAE